MEIYPKWRLTSSHSDFEEQFAAFAASDRNDGLDVSAIVQDIICNVKERGDVALAEFTLKFDQVDLQKKSIRVSVEERDALARQVSLEETKALQLAAERIRRFHEKQIPKDLSYVDHLGVQLGYRWQAVDRAGIYVPGGRAAYPSSLLMTAIPAQVAGVKSLAMVIPTPGGSISPLVVAAARYAGIENIFRVGGAQAIAALAFGTESITPVDVIVGPGNAYVSEAKRRVFGQVGIDMLAGPSEILVIADDVQNPDWIAADLLSQCEHDPSAQAILISPSADMLSAVEKAVSEQLGPLGSQAIERAAWQQHGALIEVRDLSHAASLSDRLAPEHLELAVSDPQSLFAEVRHAGSVFLGPHTPEALGDYLAGPNHVLPTARTARYASGLGVHNFMKRTTFLSANPKALCELGPAVQTLALAEGLPAHAASISVRKDQR